MILQLLALITVSNGHLPRGNSMQRTADQKQHEIDLAWRGPTIDAVLSSTNVVSDERLRKEIAPKAVPLLKNLLRLADELAATKKGHPKGQFLQSLLHPVLGALGDTQTKANLEAAARSRNRQEALAAKSATLLSRWWTTSSNPVKQLAVLAESAKLASHDRD